jgi:hypothetical protein
MRHRRDTSTMSRSELFALLRAEPVPVGSRRMKLLQEMSSPSSDWTARQPHARWVARMKEAACTNRCGQERPPMRRPE